MNGETTSAMERRLRLELWERYRAYLRASSHAWTYRDDPVFARVDRAEARAERRAAEGLAWIATGRFPGMVPPGWGFTPAAPGTGSAAPAPRSPTP